MKLENATFGIKGGLPIIKSLDLNVNRSSLTMIVGKVGSGKSTLLKGLISEIPLTSGSMQRCFAEAGFCEQQAWLVNDTIQNNILGQSKLEARWYDTVVKSCALDKDFAGLQLGDLSVIGSKGISLSGGQKQRVVSLNLNRRLFTNNFQALARAIYSRKDVVVIDDVLSGLDWTTQEFVWDNVFGRHGIFRQHGITVILATHAGKIPPLYIKTRLIVQVRHLRDADNIHVLGEDGSVLEQGSFKDLDLQIGYVQSLFLKENEKTIITSNTGSESLGTAPTKAPNASVTGATDEEKDLLRRTGDVQVYKYYLKSIGWKHSIALFTLTIAAEFCLYFPRKSFPCQKTPDEL